MLTNLNFKVEVPKVSVCIPTFNGDAFIRDAINSILYQNYQNYEIIVVDNCSTDETEAIVAELASVSNKIIYFKNEKNIGMAENFNKCIDYARGEYIKFLCVDDVLLNNCLKVMSDALDKQNKISLVCGGRVLMNEYGRPFKKIGYSSKRKIVPGHTAITKCLTWGNLIGEPSSIMFRKSEVCARFSNSYPQLMDLEMWFKILENGNLLNIEIPVCSIRIHAAQMTRVNIKSSKIVDDNILLYNEYVKKLYFKKSNYFEFCHKLMMTYRVWGARMFMAADQRAEILKKYGFHFAYFLMPIFGKISSLHNHIYFK